MTSPLLEAAFAFHQAGCSVIPARNDGTKAPFAAWKQYQLRRPTPDELRTWLDTNNQDGIGVICGAVSGQLEMLELEGRAVAEGILGDLAELAANSGLGDLWARLVGGYLELTPSGGLHLLYRVDGDAKPNTKLARRPATEEELAENANEKIKVLIETRGEGGFVVTAPSAGRTHPSGKPWTLLAGGPATIPTLTVDERDALHALSAACDRTPEPDEQPFTTPSAPRRDDAGGISPGDDYNARASWDELLGSRGWTKVHRVGRTTYWRRPGKTIGVSATTGRNDADNLYVFTTSSEFEAEKPYSKFAAYAALEHAGNFSAAAKALLAAGYGAPPPPEPRATATAAASVTVNIAEPSTYELTDDSNALRLVDTHGDAIRYVPERGHWLAWDGHRWRWDAAGHIREHARRIARDLPARTRDERKRRDFSLSARGLSAMVRVAETDPRVVASLTDLDAQPYELNTPDGVIDLRSATLRAPDPKSLHTRSSVIGADFTATPQRFLNFLADTYAGDPDLTTYVQRLLGVSIIGQVLEQILPFAYGEGANGKTTLLGVVQRVIGLGDDGYSISAPAELLLATNSAGHPTEIARLAGARLVVTSELDEGQRFAEAKVKILTGRDAVAGRFMRQDWFSFTPTHTLWLLANHQPAVRTGGPAFWRRLRLVPFLHTVPVEQRDPHLEERLVNEEGPAILAWLITGARDYLAHGLAEPDSVRTATEGYQRDQDTVARFVEETCALGDPTDQHMRVKVAELRAAYETWCRIEGETPVTSKALTLTLISRFGVIRERTEQARFYGGIRINDVSSDLSAGTSDPNHPWFT